MARITVEDCLEKVENQYDLVLLAKERTVQLNAGSPLLVEEDNDKRTIISLREIGDGKIDVKEIEESAIKRLRKEPDEVEQQEETEEETNDDFENLYKGQVSKSGVAILPSKRTRRIPEVKKPSLADEALSELKAEQPEIKEENLETEEETNDEFENLYKGQVSKSGVAILPSKRTRRIPEVKKPSLADEALSELKAEQPEIKEENLESKESPLELNEEAPIEENKTE